MFIPIDIAQLAPDPAALKAGQDLGVARKWVSVGRSERALWGEIRGSGAEPYRTQVDLRAIAFKCSCPSRKFPCKHGIGLLTLQQSDAQLFAQTDEPVWVAEWLEKRQGHTPVTAPSTTTPDLSVDKTTEKKAKEKEKRDNERWQKVTQGAAEFSLWLRDLLRQGLLHLPERPAAFFDQVAARMVDAQANGLAFYAKSLRDLPYHSGTAWQQQALDLVAKAGLLLQALERYDQLPPLVQDDVRQLLGWPQSQKDLLQNPAAERVRDQWKVLCCLQLPQDDGMVAYRQWLHGAKTQRFALLLSFVHKSQPGGFAMLPVGATLPATLAFFPSNLPQRAVLAEQGAPEMGVAHPIHAHADWNTEHAEHAERLRALPWADQMPCAVANLTPVRDEGGRWFLRDVSGAVMPVTPSVPDKKLWQLMTISGGHPVSLVLLRHGASVEPLEI